MRGKSSTLNYVIKDQEGINEQVGLNFLLFTGKSASRVAKISLLHEVMQTKRTKITNQ